MIWRIFDGPVDVKALERDAVPCHECGVMVLRMRAQSLKSNVGALFYCDRHRKNYDEAWIDTEWPPPPGPQRHRFYRKMQVDADGVPLGYTPKDRKR